MDSKQLNEYFKQIDEMERKAIELKNFIEKLKTKIKEREEKFLSVRSRLKRIDDRFRALSSQIPKTQMQVIFVELENKSFCKQIEIFEHKILDLNQRMCEMNEKRRQRIHTFSEKSFSYTQNHGFNGIIRSQNQNLQKQTQSLEEERNGLHNKNESLDRKHFETILMESNSLNHRITDLKLEKTSLQNENSEWNAIDLNLRTNLKQLRDNECKELFDLRKQLQNIEEINSKEIPNEIEVPVIQICDSNDSSDEKGDPPSKPVVPIKQNTKRPQSDSDDTQNEKIEIEKVIKSEEKDDSIVWEFIRQRKLRRKE